MDLVSARDHALVVPRPLHGTVSAAGSDRRSWLQGLVTGDLAALDRGGVLALQLTKQGKLVSELTILEAGERLLLAAAPGTHAKLVDFLRTYLVMEDVELSDESDRLAWIFVHGPGAGGLAEQASAVGAVAAGAVDYTGCGGLAMVVPRAELSRVVDALSRDPSVEVATEERWQALRIQYGVPEFGVDYTEAHRPHEASLVHRHVSFTKGCYLGQEVVCMQDKRGKVQRRIVPIRIEGGGDLPEAGAVVESRGDGAGGADGGPDASRNVGSVTSAAWADPGSLVLAMARLEAAFCEVGTVLKVAGRRAVVAGRPP
jgi:folate-binding protein YgfZ